MAERVRLGLYLDPYWGAWTAPLELQLSQAAASGFDRVALGQSFASHRWDEPERLQLLRRLLRDHQLRLVAIHGPMERYEGQWWDLSGVAAVRNRTVKKCLAALAALHALEGEVLVVHHSRLTPEEGEALSRLQAAVTSLHTLQQAASGLGISLAIENLYGEVQPTFWGLLDRFPKEQLGVCWDSGHAYLEDPQGLLLAQLRGRVRTVHLHDPTPGRDAHLLPGDGALDWPGVLHRLRDAGYRGPLMCEPIPDAYPLALEAWVREAGVRARTLAAFFSSTD